MVVEPLDEESMQVEANTEATSTETPTLEPTPTVQNTPEQGDLGETPTETPSETPTPTGTPTQEPAPTETGIPEPTLEPTLSETPEAVETQPEDSSEQSTPDQVETLIPQPTETPTLESTSTETPTPTETQMDTPLPEDFENPDGESLFLDWEGGEIVYTYDGDGNLVKSVIDNKTTYYPNQYYEKRLVDAQQTIFKYYFVGSARIALWENGTITWLLSDHLGSTSGTVNATGALVSTMKYTAFGETRGTGSSTIDYRYNGQREEEEIGLYFYRARWYDPFLSRFVQSDIAIPQSGKPQAYDRYSYVYNNPIRYTDPSGHTVCDEDGNCHNAQGWFRAPGLPRPSTNDSWKMLIRSKYSIIMSDVTGKKWTTSNLQYTYESISQVNDKLNGQLSSLVRGSVFQMGEYKATGECPTCNYDGWTYGRTVTFNTIGNVMLRQMNIFHELGHVIDNDPNKMDYFSNSLRNYDSRSFINSEGYLDGKALLNSRINDRFSGSTAAFQHPISSLNDPYRGPQEHFADIFANYVVGNINIYNELGADMNQFITEAFASNFSSTP